MSSENIKQGNPLAEEKIGRLIARFAVPAIISMLVSSLYNIVDQIFIGQGVGILGNAATNIAFPVSIICTATALLLGIGSASNYNLEAGAGRNERAAEIAGNGLAMLVICGVSIVAIEASTPGRFSTCIRRKNLLLISLHFFTGSSL